MSQRHLFIIFLLLSLPKKTMDNKTIRQGTRRQQGTKQPASKCIWGDKTALRGGWEWRPSVSELPNIDRPRPLTSNTSYVKPLKIYHLGMLEMKLWACRVIPKRSIPSFQTPTHPLRSRGHVAGQGLQYNLISRPFFFHSIHPPVLIPICITISSILLPLKHQMTHFQTREVFLMMHGANLEPTRWWPNWVICKYLGFARSFVS